MKCKLCGYKARDIAGMARHYRKAHPRSASKRSKNPPANRSRPMSRSELLDEISRRLN